MSTQSDLPAVSRRLRDLTLVAHGGTRLEGVVDLSTNVHRYGPPPALLTALASVDLQSYPDSQALGLRKVLASSVGLDADWIAVGNGSVELIYALAQAYLDPTDQVLIIGPTFGEYAQAARLCAAEVLQYMAPAATGFQPDLIAVQSLIETHSPRLVFLCNPNNPTGYRLTGNEVEQLAQAVSANGGLLLLDGAYLHLADPWPLEQAGNSLDLVGKYNLLILRSLTKEYALPGLRLGYAIGRPEIISVLNLVRPPWAVNAFAESVGKLLPAQQAYLAAVQSRLAIDKAYLLTQLATLNLVPLASQANFVLLAVGEADKCRATLLEQRVAVRDCTSFGLPHYIRIGVGSIEDTDRLIVALQKWQSPSLLNPPIIISQRKPAPGKTLMIQGTASNVGKSTVTAGLCRVFVQAGLRVAPFKAQNMALNSYITKEGGEIGRAQVVQAEACRIEPSVHMNPILLKPEGDSRAQVIVRGKVRATMSAKEYHHTKLEMIGLVEESLTQLRQEYDLVIIEGAGSPAEVNLKAGDIVNMRVAKLAQSPVLLVSDIDRGGVFASLLGTLDLLDPDERALVKGLIVNKFRGDPDLFRDGVDFLEKHSGRRVLGVLPYFHDIKIAEEDSVALEEKSDSFRDDAKADTLQIAVMRLPYMSNFDDFDALEQEPGVTLRYVNAPAELGQPDLIIIPGTKTTIADLHFLQDAGLSRAIIRLAEAGTLVVGICGGYQMLGQRIEDPAHVESRVDSVAGLGLLPVRTVFASEKLTCKVAGKLAAGRGLLQGLEGLPITGYEIHMGRTEMLEADSDLQPFIRLISREGTPIDETDGLITQRGNIFGTYLHGLFANEAFRHGILTHLLRRKGLAESGWQTPQWRRLSRDHQYDRLAELLRQNLDMTFLNALVGLA